MASVTSLDKDLRRLRLEKYTPTAANEARKWIEQILGDQSLSADLLAGLKDGVALCRLINLAVPPPGVKFKKSAMPFVQMENISHFLRACQQPPLNLQQHDMFLTVDLYEQKDPAQVLQCLGAFSRAASNVNPGAFPAPIGPRVRPASILSPQTTGPPPPSSPGRPMGSRGLSGSSNGSCTAIATHLPTTTGLFSSKTLAPSKTGDSGTQSGRWSPARSATKSPGSPGVSVSSWSRKEHEGSTAPAWNIAQYGYMGGASQGNLGIAFGGRRQITSAGPHVPNLAEKEKRRREKETAEQRHRLQTPDEEKRRKGEEEQARLDEERGWEEQTRRKAEQEHQHQTQDEWRQWEEEEQQCKLTGERRRKEEEEEAAEAQIAQERRRARSRGNSQLRGQYLSQYQPENGITPQKEDDYGGRVRELEKALELARQREADYERERAGRFGRTSTPPKNDRARSKSRVRPVSRQDSWRKNDEESLTSPRTSPALARSPPPPRPLPDPAQVGPPAKVKTDHTGGSSRPLPDPTAYAVAQNTTSPPPAQTPALPPRSANSSPFVVRSPPRQWLSPQALVKPPVQQSDPTQPRPQPTYSREVDSTAERDAEDRRRMQGQAKTKAGGFASKSLLEREMEMERQRQQEWEEAQRETAARAAEGGGDGAADGIGGRWDVSQWSGFTGGDGMNKGSMGIGASRRPVVGPRPLPGPPAR